jgi:hypothetical protein
VLGSIAENGDAGAVDDADEEGGDDVLFVYVDGLNGVLLNVYQRNDYESGPATF